MISQLYELSDYIPEEIWDYVESWFSETNSQSNESDQLSYHNPTIMYSGTVLSVLSGI